MQVLVELAELQDKEVGDGTTSVVIVAAELLKVIAAYYWIFYLFLQIYYTNKEYYIDCSLQRANDLVRNKIHPTSIISGYRVSSSFLFFPDSFYYVLTLQQF